MIYFCRILESKNNTCIFFTIVSLFFVCMSVAKADENDVFLTPLDCKLIQDMAKSDVGQTFEDHFEWMVHHVEFCIGNEKPVANCKIPVNKRSKDFSLVFFIDRRFGPAEAASEAIKYIRNFIQSNTPLEVSLGVKGGSFIGTIVLSERQLEIARQQGFTAILEMDEILQKSPEVPCLVHAPYFADIPAEKHEHNFVYLRPDLDAETLSMCLKEEIFHSLGPINDPFEQDSLFFQGDKYASRNLGPPYFQDLSERERLTLKLLYHPDIKRGMSSEQTRPIISNIIKRSCKQ